MNNHRKQVIKYFFGALFFFVVIILVYSKVNDTSRVHDLHRNQITTTSLSTTPTSPNEVVNTMQVIFAKHKMVFKTKPMSSWADFVSGETPFLGVTQKCYRGNKLELILEGAHIRRFKNNFGYPLKTYKTQISPILNKEQVTAFADDFVELLSQNKAFDRNFNVDQTLSYQDDLDKYISPKWSVDWTTTYKGIDLYWETGAFLLYEDIGLTHYSNYAISTGVNYEPEERQAPSDLNTKLVSIHTNYASFIANQINQANLDYEIIKKMSHESQEPQLLYVNTRRIFMFPDTAKLYEPKKAILSWMVCGNYHNDDGSFGFSILYWFDAVKIIPIGISLSSAPDSHMPIIKYQ